MISGVGQEPSGPSSSSLERDARSVSADPAKASGLDGALKTLGAAPFGKALLILAALGFAAYGLYSFARSRYCRL